MKIAFLSTRGIPNNYGGFEQFAQYIGVALAERHHEITVYSPHFHPYKENSYKGVKIRHIYSPEKWIGGSFGSFFYDFACLRDALKNEHYDIIYEAGYTSMIPAFIWFNIKKRKDVVITTNMDGLENKRAKFNPLVQKFLAWEERMAVKYSHYLISDNPGIKEYYLNKYGKDSTYLPYGADIHTDYDFRALSKYGLENSRYYLIVARLEPENNVSMAIEGYLASRENGVRPLVIVGKTDTPYARALLKKYGGNSNVRFIGGVYTFNELDSLRHYSFSYFHGHSVGGTNPSLLEAMAAGCCILAHRNIFNESVLGNDALYYSDATQVRDILNNMDEIQRHKKDICEANLEKIRTTYSWNHLADLHEDYFKSIMVSNASSKVK